MGHSKIIVFAQKYKIILSLILTFWGISSLSVGLKLGGGSLVLSNSIFSIVFFTLFYRLINHAIVKIELKNFFYSIITGLFFSSCLILGTQIYFLDGIELLSLGTPFHIVGLGILFSSLIYILLEKLPYIEKWCYSHDLKRFEQLFNAKPRYYFAIWIIIFISWLPTFLTAFPGIYGYDSVYQMAQFLNDHHLFAHHPIAHSLYMYGTLSFGKYVFGSYFVGMVIYSITQMLMMSAAFAYVCYFLSKLKFPIFFQILTIAYFCFLPIHSMFAVSSTKDVLFSASLILLVLCTMQMVLNPKHFFSSKADQLRFVTVAFLMFILRNNGVDLFILCIPLFIITFHKYWKKITLLCLICLGMYWLYTGPMYQLLNVQRGDMREALSVPIQQIARAMRDNPQEITNAEKKAIYKVIPENTFSQYKSRIADPVKNNFRTDVFKKNPKKYIKIWVSIGLKCPIAYINAFVSNNFGYWYPDMIYPDPVAWHPYIEYRMTDIPGKFLLIKRHSLIPPLQSYYNDIAYKTIFQKVPVLSMLFSEGFSFWVLILTGIVCFYRKQYKLYLPFTLLIGLWCTLLLSPVVLLRYAYPIMIAEPLMFAIILFGSRFNEKYTLK